MNNTCGLFREYIVEFLLENGSDIEVRNSNGNTPLILASKNGRVDTIKVLLKTDLI